MLANEYIPSFAQGWAEGPESQMPEIWDAEPMFILAPVLGCTGHKLIDLMGKTVWTKTGSGVPSWNNNGYAAIDGTSYNQTSSLTYDTSRTHTILAHWTNYVPGATTRNILSTIGVRWFGYSGPSALIFGGAITCYPNRYGSLSVAARYTPNSQLIIGKNAGKILRGTAAVALTANAAVEFCGIGASNYQHFDATCGRVHSVMLFDRYLHDDLCWKYVNDPLAFLRPRERWAGPTSAAAGGWKSYFARRQSRVIGGGVS